MAHHYYLHNRVTELVALEYDLPPEILFNKGRRHNESVARGLVIYIFRHTLNIPWGDIALYFDTTKQAIYKSLNKVENLELADKTGDLKATIRRLDLQCKQIKIETKTDNLEPKRVKILGDKRKDVFITRLDAILKHKESIVTLLQHRLITAQAVCELCNISINTLYKHVLGDNHVNK